MQIDWQGYHKVGTLEPYPMQYNLNIFHFQVGTQKHLGASACALDRAPANFHDLIFTARKRSLRRLCFYTCVSVHGGGGWCLLQGGLLPEGCLLPGGACFQGGSAPGVEVWRPPHDGYCCGRYASHWNAFLCN